jgi:flagellar hook-length control protein FliK
LGSRVLWLSKDNQQYAELRLNPPHLGPLEVRISLQSDQGTSLSFLSNHAAVRDAVAGALPQLREMLADGGFTMLDVNVSHHSAGGDSAWAAPRDGQGAHAMGAQEGAAAADKEGDGQQRLLPGQGVGLVDYFV